MKDIEKRIQYWSNNARLNGFGGKWYNDDILKALYNLEIFKDQDVLEIGPGIGRQFKMFHEFADSYEVADISPEVLEMEIYDKVYCNQIRDWKDNFGIQYDIIMFWFVVHHMTCKEIKPFIRFLKRHLREGGIIIFNSPLISDKEKHYQEDGMRTTPWKEKEICSYFKRQRFKIAAGPIICKSDEFYIFKI
jgi:cyclopropane fatty-acyl-phospholipid synthase-like methyltransferase